MTVEATAQMERWTTPDCEEALRRRVLTLSGSFPSAIEPMYGVFVKERLRFVARLPGMDVRVVSPVPYFPKIKWFKRWYLFSQMPREEVVDGLQVVRPRYFLPPKIGGYIHPSLMYRATRRAIDRLLTGFDFDLIDSHFVYPSGVVAAMLGARYGKPVVITGRGEEIARFIELPIIGRSIRWALREATQLIAVSQEIAEKMVRHGADPAKVSVISNGVDLAKFQPVAQDSARRELGLPMGRRIVLAVGYRLELKGFHVLVDSIPRIREQFPDVLVVIVGGKARWAADYLPEIQAHIRRNGVADHVHLAGTRPQEELHWWYSAADLLVILSSREGSSNVLMESLACGLPVVATRVGCNAEVLTDERLGVLLPERSANAAATGVVAALSRAWDRKRIRTVMNGYSWNRAAQQVSAVFDRAMASCTAPGSVLTRG